jgi:uncharacterized membrane protein YdbT with pleckstrin-like domain
MAFPRKLLNEGEQVVLDLRPHWSFFAGPTAALAAALVLAIVVHGVKVLNVASLAVALAALLWILGRYARWATTNFVVTSDRLIHRYGVLAKRGQEILLERINDVSYRRTLLQRVIGAGDLVIESAGEKGQEPFDHISHPERVQNTILRTIEEVKDRDADRQAGRRELSPLEQIEKLDELRQRGVISQAEFEAKKAQLLDRL